MINTEKLKKIISDAGTSQRQVAKQLEITEKTFYAKMKMGIFSSSEIEKMIDILDIKDPICVFFPSFSSKEKKAGT